MIDRWDAKCRALMFLQEFDFRRLRELLDGGVGLKIALQVLFGLSEDDAEDVLFVFDCDNHRSSEMLLKKLYDRALPSRFTARDVYARGWKGLLTKDDAKKAIDGLLRLGVLAAETRKSGGRPTTVFAYLGKHAE